MQYLVFEKALCTLLVASTQWRSLDSFGSQARGTHCICLQQFRPHSTLCINPVTWYNTHTPKLHKICPNPNMQLKNPEPSFVRENIMHMNRMLYHPVYKQADVWLEGEGTTAIHEHWLIVYVCYFSQRSCQLCYPCPCATADYITKIQILDKEHICWVSGVGKGMLDCCMSTIDQYLT